MGVGCVCGGEGSKRASRSCSTLVRFGSHSEWDQLCLSCGILEYDSESYRSIAHLLDSIIHSPSAVSR